MTVTAPWSVAEFLVHVAGGVAVAVECVHCGTPVEFAQPDYSADPGDVTVANPGHPCPSRPATIPDAPEFPTDEPPS